MQQIINEKVDLESKWVFLLDSWLKSYFKKLIVPLNFKITLVLMILRLSRSRKYTESKIGIQEFISKTFTALLPNVLTLGHSC